MKTSNRNKLLSLALAGSFSLFGASHALADAGDTISNFATLSYDVGGATQTVIESGVGPAGNSVPGVGQAVLLGITTDFLEDRIVNFTVVREGAAVAATPGGTHAIPYLVDNTGNGTHGFLLRGVHNSGALDPHGSPVNDDITPTTIETWVDVDNNGVFLAATDNVAFIGSLAHDAVNPVRVFVVSDIPLVDDTLNPLVDADIAVMSLVAQATSGVSTGVSGDALRNDDNGNTSPGGTFTNGAAVVVAGVAVTNPDIVLSMETVFNDTAVLDPITGATIDATGAADASKNAQQSSYSSYTIATAALTVSKVSVAWWDPINLATSPKAIPGGYVQYTITIANAAGAADADLTTVQDVLNAALDLDADFGDGTAANNPTNAVGDGIEVTHVDNVVTIYCTGASDADGCDYSAGPGGTIDVNINTVMGAANAQLSAGESLTVTFNVIVQ